jgi:hypothetical protein
MSSWRSHRIPEGQQWYEKLYLGVCSMCFPHYPPLLWSKSLNVIIKQGSVGSV